MRVLLALTVVTVVGLAGTPTLADEDDGIGKIKTGVPNAVTPVPNSAQPSLIDPDFALRTVAIGTDPLENPSGVITKFGQLASGVNTEPDENLYLKFSQNPGGPTPGFNYGRNFLYQGHENAGNLAYVTRINLDVTDPAHRITLLTPVNPTTGLTGFNRIDGSTWNPFTKTLLFAQEDSALGGIIQITPNWPPQVTTLYQFLGRAAYEGIHSDDKGVIYMEEDTAGPRPGGLATIDGVPNLPLKAAAQPNSFVYRYVPNNPERIEDGGKLQALQVIIDGSPVVFHAADPVGDITAKVQRQLHTPGTSWPIKWVTVHTANKDDPPSACSMQMPPPRRRAPRPSSGRRTWPGCRARAFALSSSARLATRTRPRARFRSWRHAAPGARSSALILVVTMTIMRITTVKESRAKKTARFRFSFLATRSTVRSTTLPSPTSASCWPPRIAAIPCTTSYRNSTRFGRST